MVLVFDELCSERLHHWTTRNCPGKNLDRFLRWSVVEAGLGEPAQRAALLTRLDWKRIVAGRSKLDVSRVWMAVWTGARRLFSTACENEPSHDLSTRRGLCRLRGGPDLFCDTGVSTNRY